MSEAGDISRQEIEVETEAQSSGRLALSAVPPLCQLFGVRDGRLAMWALGLQLQMGLA